MGVSEVIKARRAYRSLERVNITDDLIKDLAYHASLAPSCYNNQPWRFVFVRSPQMLSQVFKALPRGNRWATRASLVIAVYSRKEDDCLIREREYFLFDTGLATAFLILRATELGLVAHPIAGYDAQKLKEILNLPEDAVLITLVVVGKHTKEINELLSEKQAIQERERPPRKPFEEFAKII